MCTLFIQIMERKRSEFSFDHQQLAQLKKSFDLIDEDGNGYLDEDELRNFLIANDLELQYLPMIFKLFDENKDGMISFEEFTNYLDAIVKSQSNFLYLYSLTFNAIDTNKNGMLDSEEIQEFGRICGYDFSKEKIEEMIEMYDTNGDGQLDFEEMRKVFDI